MKTLQTTIVLLLLTLSSFAQGDKFTIAMQKGLTQLDSAKTTADYTNAANYFERIAIAEKQQWLAQYYTSFCNLHIALTGQQDEETKDALYDKAMEFADKADVLMPNNSEVYALKAYITFMKMAVAPQARAMSMIPKANALAEQAIAFDTANPRAYLMKGQNLFYTPEMFGGGKTKAQPILLTAKEKFATATATGLLPKWGQSRCETLLKQIN